MPYPAQVNPERILEQARALIASEGAAALSLGKLAAELGIKPPSLYRYFASKEALIRTLNEQTNAGLFAALAAAQQPDDTPLDVQLIYIAHAYRRFALENASMYMLAFTTTQPDLLPDITQDEQRVLPYQHLLEQWSGEKPGLNAIRGFAALAHGFVMLEINRQFRRQGGDLESAYEAAFRAFLDGLRGSQHPRPHTTF